MATTKKETILLSDVSEIIPICKKCGRGLGTWSEHEYYCRTCVPLEERLLDRQSHPERTKAADEFLNHLHTAITRPDLGLFDIRLILRKPTTPGEL